jgi:hypothetical protein
MIILQLTLVLIFAFILRNIYIYLDQNTYEFGSGQNIIMTIIMWIMIGNIIVISGIFLYKYYQTEWRMMGRSGKQGLDGPPGKEGYPKCKPTDSAERAENC